MTQDQQTPSGHGVAARLPTVVLTIQVASVCAFAILLLMPFEVPDPFGVGPDLSWTVACLIAATMVLLPELLVGGWPRTRVDWPLAAYVAITVATWITSVDRVNTLVWMLALAGDLAVFAAIVVVARKARWVPVAFLVYLVADVALLLLMATQYHAEVGLIARPKVYPSPQGWIGYPELGMLGAIQFGVLLAGVQAGTRVRTILAAAVLLAVVVAEVALLYARGAWVAMGCVLAAAGVFLVSRGGVKRALAALCAVIVVGGALVVTNPTVKHLVTGGGGTSIEGNVIEVAPAQMRLDLWRRALRMVRDHAIAGVGLGNFRSVFETVYNPEVNSDLRRGVHAHNAWLQQFAELGVIGGAAYVILWAWLFVIACRRAYSTPDFPSVALMLALVAVIASNVTTNMYYLPGQAPGRLYSVTWVFFGLVAARDSGRALGARRSGLGTED